MGLASRSRWLAGLVGSVVVIAAPLAADAGEQANSAQKEIDATCIATERSTITPGVSLVPSRGTIRSESVVDCEGVIGGVAVRGPGTARSKGTYGTGELTSSMGDTCLLGSGSSRFVATLPKVGGGTVKVRGTYNYRWIFPVLDGWGEIAGVPFRAHSNVLLFQRDPGQDCVNVPLTDLTVTQHLVVGSGVGQQ